MILQEPGCHHCASAHTQVLAQLLMAALTLHLAPSSGCPPGSDPQSTVAHQHCTLAFSSQLFCTPTPTSRAPFLHPKNLLQLEIFGGQLPFRPSDKPTLLFSRVDRPGGRRRRDWSPRGAESPPPSPCLAVHTCAGDQLSMCTPREASYINNDENPFFLTCLWIHDEG